MRFVNLHTHKSTEDPEVIEVLNVYPNEMLTVMDFFSSGIHPWHIKEDRIESDLQMMENRLSLYSCVAIGECGLDKKIEIPMELQSVVFEKQLRIAQKYKRPVIIHCVAAFDEVIAIKKKTNFNLPMVIHGFSKNAQVAEQMLDNGFYLSFGKYLVQNPELEQVFKMIPDDRFFLETDSSDYNIKDVYALAAKYRGISVEELKNLVLKNFNAVFNRHGKLNLE